MTIKRIGAKIFEAALLVGLAVAYGAAAAGLIGWLDARAVSFWTLVGGTMGFLAAVGYFVISDHELRRHSAR